MYDFIFLKKKWVRERWWIIVHCLIVINNETENIALEFLTFPLNTMETKNNTYKFYLASKNIVPLDTS